MLLPILTILIVLFISWQDFTTRLVSLPLIILLSLLGIIMLYQAQIEEHKLMIVINNLTFLSIQGLLIILYQYFKKQSIRSILKNKIGAGDILIYIVITPFFSLLNYVSFYLVSVFVSLFVFIICKALIDIKTLPYVGVVGVVFSIVLILELSIETFSQYDEYWLNQLIAS